MTTIGTKHKTREYVRSAELAALMDAWLAKPAHGPTLLAQRAGVSDRAVGKVLREQEDWPWTALDMADRLLTAMGLHLAHVETVERPARV
jgi:hypothetical protein